MYRGDPSGGIVGQDECEFRAKSVLISIHIESRLPFTGPIYLNNTRDIINMIDTFRHGRPLRTATPAALPRDSPPPPPPSPRSPPPARRRGWARAAAGLDKGQTAAHAAHPSLQGPPQGRRGQVSHSAPQVKRRAPVDGHGNEQGGLRGTEDVRGRRRSGQDEAAGGVDHRGGWSRVRRGAGRGGGRRGRSWRVIALLCGEQCDKGSSFWGMRMENNGIR